MPERGLARSTRMQVAKEQMRAITDGTRHKLIRLALISSSPNVQVMRQRFRGLAREEVSRSQVA